MSKSLFVKLSFFATLLAFIVVVLGAFTRLTDAGLGCPDWPGCYGQMLPPTDDAAAWTEMIHRYFAGTLGLVILLLALIALKNRKQPDQKILLPLMLLGLVIFQALLGMWTVTLLLHPLVVMGHLLGGMATLGLLWWLTLRSSYSSANRDLPPPTPPYKGGETREIPPLCKGGLGGVDPVGSRYRKWVLIGLIILIIQIALGGWVSANYAALACPDFPTCQGKWWPSMDFYGALTVWKEWGMNFEGGVLSNEARTAIHMMHRLGALVTFFYLGWLAVKCMGKGMVNSVKVAGLFILLVLFVQISLGISTVLLTRPLDVAVAHNAVAAFLLLSVITLNYLLRWTQGEH